MTNTDWRRGYHTSDELAFLRELRAENPEAYRRYSALIRSGARAYDATVDPAVVVAELNRIEAVQ